MAMVRSFFRGYAGRLILCSLALVAFAGCGGGVSETATTGSDPVATSATTTPLTTPTTAAGHTMRGVFTLTVDEQLTKGSDCAGPPPYDDLRGGTPVLVKNESGEEIGRGVLQTGRASEDTFGATPPICEFEFEIDGLPDAASYTIAINHVDDQTLTAAELEEQAWMVEFGFAMAVGG